MSLDTNQYLGIFVEETREHLQNMNDVLLELEKQPSDLGYINEIFRVAHTLKGMSGTMGYHNMANLTHEMENLLEAARSQEIELSLDVIDLLFECFDTLEEILNHIVETGNEGDDKHGELIGRVLDVLGKESEIVEEASKANKDGELVLDRYILEAIEKAKEADLNILKIKFVLEESCMLKSARAFIIFNELEGKGDIIYSNPPAEDIEDEKFDREFTIILITELKKEEIKSIVDSISELEKVELSDLEDLDIVAEEVDDKKESKKSEAPSKERNTVTKIRKTVRVDIDRLDNLMNLVSELIIIKTRMDGISREFVTNDMSETIEYLERITTNLHDAVMKVRMVPIERVFNRFPRLVRDVSRELKKEINLEMSGEDTEVDRSIIDEIGDPLIHLIRNSLDHGIGLPDQREKQGKPRQGTVILKAYPDGNNVVIEVEDDGKGIDSEVIRSKALERGIITEQESKNINSEEALSLLFEAGLSTSEEVSDVSGRGVGLDVVRTKIESINGDIEVNTELGKGTKFIIRIPLTLAIIQALMIELGEEIFAIPLSAITEITDISTEDVRVIQGEEVIVYRDNTIPLIRLGRVLGAGEAEESETRVVVIVNKGDRQAALLIDRLIGQQEIVIKNLGKYLNDVRYISGATILGDGSISLIIDINALL